MLVQYAVFAAEQVIDLFEQKYPDDKRPREAIEAAKKCIDDPSEKNKVAAAAYTAAYAADTADAAADGPGVERVDGQTVRLRGDDIRDLIYRRTHGGRTRDPAQGGCHDAQTTHSR